MAEDIRKLNFIFTENDFYPDSRVLKEENTDPWTRCFEENRYQALYQMGFAPRGELSATGAYLYQISEMFLKCLTSLPGLELAREISFQCSCPDWALMCKHVAAALYGVGVRLDENPLLFFELRGIDVGRFIDVTLANKMEAMLANEDKPSDRIIDEVDTMALFGI